MNSQKKLYIAGGFGNQLFQYLGAAYLRQLSISDVVICAELQEKNIFTTYILRWSIFNNLAETVFADFKFSKKGNVTYVFDYLLIICSRIFKVPVFGRLFVDTRDQKISATSSVYFSYFQNLEAFPEEHFQTCSKKLCRNLGIGSVKDYTVVHLRWGDSEWLKENYDYYDAVVSHCKLSKVEILIVTDDESKSADLFRDSDVKYKIQKMSVLDDFRTLAEAKTIYVGPSTFSWWAAVINDGVKNIYMPQFLIERFPRVKNYSYVDVRDIV